MAPPDPVAGHNGPAFRADRHLLALELVNLPDSIVSDGVLSRHDHDGHLPDQGAAAQYTRAPAR